MGRAILALMLAVLSAAALAACGDAASTDSATTPAAEVTSTAPTPAATETTTGGPSDAELARLYADNCSGCHGADGGGGSAPAIAGEDDVAGIQRWIERGGEGMPGYSGTLTPGQIQAIARYVAGGLQ